MTTIAASATRTSPAPRPVTARLSLVATAGFLLLLIALHALRSDLEPSWHFISEYGVGEFGWVMSVAFFAGALGSITLCLALRPYTGSIVGRIGLAMLLVSAAGQMLAGLFPMDPLMTPPDSATLHGGLHNLGGTLGIAGPIGVALVSYSLVRHPAWCAGRRALLAAAAVALLGFGVSAVGTGVLIAESGGAFGPDVPVGWPNRLGAVAGSAWAMVTAWQAARRLECPDAGSREDSFLTEAQAR